MEEIKFNLEKGDLFVRKLIGDEKLVRGDHRQGENRKERRERERRERKQANRAKLEKING